MRIAPTVTFRGIRRSTALEGEVLTRLRKLERYYPAITGCRVIVELLQRHHQHGNRYHVRICLTVPGEELAVAHDASLRAATRGVHARKITRLGEPAPERKHGRVAIHEAFDAARRQLQDYARRQRGTVKRALKPARGRVVRLFPVDEYGYIEAEDGHDVYFQKRSVLKDAFDRLNLASAVSYVEEAGDKGPQASTVRLLHPHRVHRPSHAAVSARLVR